MIMGVVHPTTRARFRKPRRAIVRSSSGVIPSTVDPFVAYLNTYNLPLGAPDGPGYRLDSLLGSLVGHICTNDTNTHGLERPHPIGGQRI